eukprot:GEMP01004520.1.p1 GENE.GEMP01004520.1~~GEMP01004520.1.p1  ORF type:complete len:846 (+),score=179.33 GEMP01004520.1:612-3149(+)
MCSIKLELSWANLNEAASGIFSASHLSRIRRPGVVTRRLLVFPTHGKDPGMETIPAVPDDHPEGSIPFQVGELPEATDELVDGHIQLYRKLQGRWQSFDAYSRVAMALGFNQVIQAICTFIIMHMTLEQNAPWGAFMACLPLQFVSLVLLNLDIKHAQAWEFYMALAGSFGAPFANLAAIIFYHEAKHIPWLTRATVVLCFFFHAAWLIVARRFARPEVIDGVSLPFRFRSVLYLDVFADTAKAKKQTGKPGEARKEALTNLQKVMDDALLGKNAPYPTLRALKAAAERCMDLVDSPEDDAEIHSMVMKAALHFEEQKLRATELNVRRALRRWNSEAVQAQLTEYARGHIRTLEKQLEATQEELMDSPQPPALGGARRGLSLLSTGSCGLLEIDYDTGYEQTSFYYNRHTDEVIWEADDGMENRQRESLESLTVKVQNFRDEVEEFLQMSKFLTGADDVSSASHHTLADPSTWEVRATKTGTSLSEESKKDRRTDAAGNPVLQQASSTLSATPSAFKKIYQAASSAVMPRQHSESREAFRPIIAEHDENILYSPRGIHLDKDLRRAASFVPGASDSARRRGLARRNRSMGDLRKGISFIGEKAFCDTFDAESVSPPERLPWGCVRGSLNAFCIMWVLAGVVGVLDLIIPHGWWPWHGSPGTGDPDLYFERCPEINATLAYAYPTPHFEARALRCADGVVCENRFGLSWARSGSSWNHVNTTLLDHSDVYVGDRTYRLSGTPQEPFAVSTTAAAAFDGNRRVVVYRLEPSPKMLYGVKVNGAPRSVDIHEDELIILHANSTVVRYHLTAGQFLASVRVRNDTVAACKSGHVLLIAVPGEISGGIIT